MTFHLYTSKIKLSKEIALSGFGDTRYAGSHSDILEVSGFGIHTEDMEKSLELCAVDALYAGELNVKGQENDIERIFAASHTHYAPMLDKNKPKLGEYSQVAVDAYLSAIKTAERKTIEIDSCSIFRSTVNVPIYRRIDVPDNWLNRNLTKHIGMFPNDKQEIDNNVYIFVFKNQNENQFCIIYHACHPVSRSKRNALSPDYIGALREATRRRFNVDDCLFFLGCSGDIRPNITKKIVNWLPALFYNKRFRHNISAEIQRQIDMLYEQAVKNASGLHSFLVNPNNIFVKKIKVELTNGKILYCPQIKFLNDIEFIFLPFELSHFYHLELKDKNKKFLVSCCGDTLGYLPHAKQIKAGGYEVNGSSEVMNLDEGLELKERQLYT